MCVTDLRRDTTVSKGTLNFTQNACRFFSLYVHDIFFFFTSARRSASSVWICAEKDAVCLTLISNNAFFHTCMHEALKTVQSFKSERYRKIYNVIRARRSRDGSLTATLYIRVINTYAPYNNDFSHGGQTIE